MFGSVPLHKVFLFSLTGPTCQIELVPVKGAVSLEISRFLAKIH